MNKPINSYMIGELRIEFKEPQELCPMHRIDIESLDSDNGIVIWNSSNARQLAYRLLSLAARLQRIEKRDE